MLAAVLPGLAGAAEPAGPAGTWQGAIELPGTELEVKVRLAQAESQWSGTIDIPAQGAKGLALTGISVRGPQVEFAIQGIPGNPKFSGSLLGDSIRGTFTQGPQSFGFYLDRTEEPAAGGKPGAGEKPQPAAGARPGSDTKATTAADQSGTSAKPGSGSVPPAGTPDFSGHWEGSIQSLSLLIDLVQKDGVWSGTIDIPMQGAKGLPLDPVKVDGANLEFALKNIPGNPTFRGTYQEGKIAGNFSQSGMNLPLVLGRERLSPPARPQEPKPPFPYRSEEITYTNGDITIAGTLTLPETGGPFPAVLLITGSGPENRDEEIFGHKPFLVLADHLTRGGIAVLRVDDRGVGGSTGAGTRPTSADLAQDVLAGVRFLKSRADIDPRRIGLVGHSEGGLIAPLVASQSPDVAFIVLLAGPGVPGDEILTRQMKLLYEKGGVPSDRTERVVAEQRRLLEMVRAGADTTELRAQVRKLVQAQLEADTSTTAAGHGNLDALAQMALKQVTAPWMRYFITYDPRPTLRRVRVPVLALNGELDLQVDPEQNLPEIQKALERGGNQNVTVRRLPGLNHLFQKAGTGLVEEYATIEETMNPEALGAVLDWVSGQKGQ